MSEKLLSATILTFLLNLIIAILSLPVTPKTISKFYRVFRENPAYLYRGEERETRILANVL